MEDDLKALRLLRGGRILALRSSGPELVLPRIFQALFASLIVIIGIVVALNWDDFVRSLSFQLAQDK
jgi:hypothetical protein